MTLTRNSRSLILAAICGLAGTSIVLIGVSTFADYLFSPPRRQLQDYHKHRLAYPAAYGLNISAFECIEGKVPCLLVEPDGDAGPGERGTKLRRQLAEMGLAVLPYGTVGGIVVLLHERAGRKEDLLPVAERFVAAGFRCLIPDLPAHGESPLPRVAFGAGEFESALPRQALANARRMFALPQEPAALWGISMGGAFAIRAANESPYLWEALVVVSSFDALDKVIAAQRWNCLSPIGTIMSQAVDAIRLVEDQPKLSAIRPEAWATQVKVPALVVHGERDELVPIERGRKLFEGFASQEKRWIQVRGGGHHDLLTTPAPLYAEMSAWLLRWMRLPTIDERQPFTSPDIPDRHPGGSRGPDPPKHLIPAGVYPDENRSHNDDGGAEPGSTIWHG